MEYRTRTFGNLALALGFSTALHAAVLTSLEGRIGRSGQPDNAALKVQLRADRTAPAARSTGEARRKGAAGSRPTHKALAARYLPMHEVDTPARPRGTVPLIYPENPLIWRLAGVVRLRLLINEEGIVDAAEVVSAQPEGEFEEAALAAARRLVYDPALRNGRPVKSEKLIEVTFDPYEHASPQ